MSHVRFRLLAVVALLLGCTSVAFAADPTIVFETQPGPTGTPPVKGALKFKLKWTDCTNAQKLDVTMYEATDPPRLVTSTVLDPIPGGANGSITITMGDPSMSGKKAFIKAKVIDNTGMVIAEETSMTVTVP